MALQQPVYQFLRSKAYKMEKRTNLIHIDNGNETLEPLTSKDAVSALLEELTQKHQVHFR